MATGAARGGGGWRGGRGRGNGRSNDRHTRNGVGYLMDYFVRKDREEENQRKRKQRQRRRRREELERCLRDGEMERAREIAKQMQGWELVGLEEALRTMKITGATPTPNPRSPSPPPKEGESSSTPPPT
ncbi:hypothetical protein GBAR_LOCUS19875, partial [Geodia barretti]